MAVMIFSYLALKLREEIMSGCDDVNGLHPVTTSDESWEKTEKQ